jgi:hypothetical protein
MQTAFCDAAVVKSTLILAAPYYPSGSLINVKTNHHNISFSKPHIWSGHVNHYHKEHIHSNVLHHTRSNKNHFRLGVYHPWRTSMWLSPPLHRAVGPNVVCGVARRLLLLCEKWGGEGRKGVCGGRGGDDMWYVRGIVISASQKGHTDRWPRRKLWGRKERAMDERTLKTPIPFCRLNTGHFVWGGEAIL